MSDLHPSYSVDKRNKPEQSDELNIIEIDLFEKAQQIWDGRKTVMIFMAVFLSIGLFHYSFAPDEYVSTATLIQEAESGGSFQGGGGFLQSLAGGLNLQNSSSSLSAAARGRAPLPVNLYPVIVNSTDFQKELIYREIQFSNPDTTLTLFDYYQNYYEEPFRDRVYGFIGDMTIFLPVTLFEFTESSLKTAIGFLKDNDAQVSDEQTIDEEEGVGENSFSNSNIQVMTGAERGVIEKMKLRITLSAEGGLTTITVMLPDNMAAANVNAILVEKLQDFITEYRIEKARQNLEAIRQQEEDARLRYEEAQMELASFEDQNINISTNIAQTRVEHLRNQRNLRFQVYNSIAQEVEQARMSLEQQIPLFNILEKPNLPQSSAPNSSNLILVFSLIIGLFTGVGYVLIKSSSVFGNLYQGFKRD
jgi:capsule polysaccharide export protein KpsE/RkpR